MTFLNNKKAPYISPLFCRNEYVIDFRERAELFNDALREKPCVAQFIKKIY